MTAEQLVALAPGTTALVVLPVLNMALIASKSLAWQRLALPQRA